MVCIIIPYFRVRRQVLLRAQGACPLGVAEGRHAPFFMEMSACARHRHGRLPRPGRSTEAGHRACALPRDACWRGEDARPRSLVHRSGAVIAAPDRCLTPEKERSMHSAHKQQSGGISRRQFLGALGMGAVALGTANVLPGHAQQRFVLSEDRFGRLFPHLPRLF